MTSNVLDTGSLTTATLEDCLRQIRAQAGDKPMQAKAKQIIYRPEDIQRIADIRGMTYGEAYAELMIMVKAMNDAS